MVPQKFNPIQALQLICEINNWAISLRRAAHLLYFSDVISLAATEARYSVTSCRYGAGKCGVEICNLRYYGDDQSILSKDNAVFEGVHPLVGDFHHEKKILKRVSDIFKRKGTDYLCALSRVEGSLCSKEYGIFTPEQMAQDYNNFFSPSLGDSNDN